MNTEYFQSSGLISLISVLALKTEFGHPVCMLSTTDGALVHPVQTPCVHPIQTPTKSDGAAKSETNPHCECITNFNSESGLHVVIPMQADYTKGE